MSAREYSEQAAEDYPVVESDEVSLNAKRSQLRREKKKQDWKDAGKILTGLLAMNELLNIGISKSGPGPGWGDLIK